MAEKERNQIRGRRLKPRSEMWEHFTRHTGDDGKDKAQCKRCGKVYAYHGTKNLREHYDKGCVGQEESADAGAAEQPPQALPSLAQDEEAMQQQLPPSACDPSSNGGSSERESSGSLKEEASKHLARMIALGGYDASVLEDHWFKSFVRSLNPEYVVPPRVVIENMCEGIFDEARRDLLARLRRAPGKVNLAVGRAKTMEEQVLYVACHFIDDGWNLHNLLLHAAVTTDHHDDDDGPILGLDISTYAIHEPVGKVISDHDIDDSLFMVACETTDEDILLPLRHKYSLWPGLANPNREEMLFTTYVDNVLHSIARCLLPGAEFTLEVSFGMMDLLLTRQGRLELLAELDLHYGWAYDEHWYACYCSLKVLCKKGIPPQRAHAEIAVIIELLCKLWEKIHRAIQKISSSTCPTGNLCLAELFKLSEILQLELARFSREDLGDFCGLFNNDKGVTCVLAEASDTLDNAIEDFYLAWSLPLALDPRYKLEFITFNFKRVYDLEAAEQHVSMVTTMITELYADYVKQYGTAGGAYHSDGASAMDTTTSADDPLEQAWNEHCRSQQAMTTQVIRGYYPEAETELDRYLKDPLASHHPQAEGFDILNWWKVHSSKYPMVARMARDALAMPTCSKLSSEQMAQVRSILRGYSKKPYGAEPEEFIAPLCI